MVSFFLLKKLSKFLLNALKVLTKKLLEIPLNNVSHIPALVRENQFLLLLNGIGLFFQQSYVPLQVSFSQHFYQFASE